MVERNVANAPSNCDANAGGDGIPATCQPASVADANGLYAGTMGVAVSFSSAGSNDPNGNSASFTWDFGDGSTSRWPIRGTRLGSGHLLSDADVDRQRRRDRQQFHDGQH